MEKLQLDAFCYSNILDRNFKPLNEPLTLMYEKEIVPFDRIRNIKLGMEQEAVRRVIGSASTIMHHAI